MGELEMNKEKQIEEMAKLLHGYCKAPCPNGGCDSCVAYDKAKALFDAGYCKASDVAEEIFAEIDKILSHKRDFNCSEIAFGYEWALAEVCRRYVKLKKKYTEGEE
jgi:hypothetical protein